MKLLRYILFISLALPPMYASAANYQTDTILAFDSSNLWHIGENIHVLEDNENILDIRDVLLSKSFNKVELNVPNFGVTKNTHWILFTIHSNINHIKILQIELPDYKEIDIFDSLDFNNYESKSFSSEAVNSDKDIFFNYPLNLAQNETRTIAIKIVPNANLQLPISLVNYDTYDNSRLIRNRWIGLFTGIFLVMILYNLFLFLSIRDSIYLIYVIYIVILFLTQSALLGAYQNYFPFFGLGFNSYAVHIFSGLAGISGSFFSFRFMKVKTIGQKLVIGFYVIYFLYALSIFFKLLGLSHLCHSSLAATGGLSALYILVTAIIISNKNYRPAKFFLFAWILFLTGLFIYILRDIGFLPYNSFTNYTIPVGSALETILLSFALADRINTLKKEKELTQVKMYDEMKKNRDIIRNQKNNLEKMVDDRTQSLEKTNTNLQETLDNLKATQSQLVDAEKMASLGQLTAGIAHEINNPINFVSSNISPLRQDISDLLEILNKYQTFASENNIEALKEIENEAKSLELDYSISEINDLLNGIEEGAKRTSTIVNSLRSFSRSDEESFSNSDINIGIESTLTILKSEIGKISVDTDLGEIPKIDCYPGKLNQVFMNLIDNSLDAVKSRHGNTIQGQIAISTYLEDEFVFIEIQDNGDGIDEQLIHKVFDPFFTTKEVGEGTGLGLSISYGIVENHNGTISVKSKKGRSTTFTVKLPTIQSIPNV